MPRGFPPPAAVAIFCLAFPLPLSFGMSAELRGLWTGGVFAFFAINVLMGRCRLARGWELWLVCAALAAASAVISSGFADNPSAHWQVAAFIVTLWAVVPPVIAFYVSHRRGLVAILASSFVSAQTASSAIALSQALTGSEVAGAVAEHGRSPGLAGHTNILGLLAGVAVLLCIAALRERRYPRLACFAIAINGSAALASGSLTALMALILGTICMFWVWRVPLRALVIWLSGLGVMVGLSVQLSASLSTWRSPLQRVMQTTGQTGEVSTLDIRLRTVEWAWARILEQPLYGYGLDDASGVTFDQLTLTHNLPIRAWFQGGVLLAFAVVAIYISAVVLVLRAGSARVGATEVAVIVALLVFGLTSASFQQPYFWLVLIVAWCSLQHVFAIEAPNAFGRGFEIAKG